MNLKNLPFDAVIEQRNALNGVYPFKAFSWDTFSIKSFLRQQLDLKVFRKVFGVTDKCLNIRLPLSAGQDCNAKITKGRRV